MAQDRRNRMTEPEAMTTWNNRAWGAATKAKTDDLLLAEARGAENIVAMLVSDLKRAGIEWSPLTGQVKDLVAQIEAWGKKAAQDALFHAKTAILQGDVPYQDEIIAEIDRVLEGG
jgi:hypothetical protein